MNIVRGLLAIALTASIAPAAHAVPVCTVASGASLAFGNVVALASTGDIGSNTGSSLWINCNAEVGAMPRIHSASQRVMVSGAGSLPFLLSMSSPGGIELPVSAPGAVAVIALDGSNQTVTLHGKIFAADFSALPSGSYLGQLVITVEY